MTSPNLMGMVMKHLDRAEALRLFEQRTYREGPEDCWIWLGSTNPKGYGTLSCRGVPLKAHRVSWWLFKGEIPSGLFVLHRCDVRDCVNPNHLFLGTHQDNMDDMRKKQRAKNQFTCPTAKPRKKVRPRLPSLTNEQASKIEQFYKDNISKPTLLELSILYGVSVTTIFRAVYGNHHKAENFMV